jgi:hypothetical protein
MKNSSHIYTIIFPKKSTICSNIDASSNWSDKGNELSSNSHFNSLTKFSVIDGQHFQKKKKTCKRFACQIELKRGQTWKLFCQIVHIFVVVFLGYHEKAKQKMINSLQNFPTIYMFYKIKD